MVNYLLSAGAGGTVVVWRFNMVSVSSRTFLPMKPNHETTVHDLQELFEWVHMETVFDCAIEYVQLDDTHNLLAVTALGRIAVYRLAKENGGMNDACNA